ncbi:MAG: hypothetical protein J3R72DRAFT_202152 [Linnemannia gamsii]|nr:MAG: hypothetical protein J3R72DRAFT_202152 [Linnemannia gamsii]
MSQMCLKRGTYTPITVRKIHFFFFVPRKVSSLLFFHSRLIFAIHFHLHHSKHPHPTSSYLYFFISYHHFSQMSVQVTIIIPNMQAVRRVFENDSRTTATQETASFSGPIFHLPYHADPSCDRDILLWDDILNVFSNALFVRSGNIILPFLKGAHSQK